MPFNGSGTFVRVHDWTDDAAGLIKIRADRHDEEDDGFATGLSNCIARDGQSTTTQRIAFAAGSQINSGTAAVPATNFSGDTDTGVFSPNSDQWAVSPAGAQRFLVTTSGVSVTGTFAVSSTSTFTGAVTCSATLGVVGDFAVNTNKFTVAAASGN